MSSRIPALLRIPLCRFALCLFTLGLFVLISAAAWSAPAAPASASPPPLSEAEVRSLLRARIDEQRQSLGMVVGIVSPEGERVVSYGRLSAGRPQAPDANTLFEVGSVTKVFTGLLLAQMVQAGKIRLEDPISRYLPPGTEVPSRGGKPITVLDLATQRSGLPWWPRRQPYADPHNPWARYSQRQLYSALATAKLAHDPGAAYGYSNFGFGLLGQAIAERARSPYPELVRKAILAPLGMESTAVVLTPELQHRLSPGHTAGLRAAEHWELGALAAAGGFYSTAHDLLLFLAAETNLRQTPLAAAMEYQWHAVSLPTDTPGTGIALAWRVMHGPGGALVWHAGGTGGFASFIGFDPAHRRGVVVLSNAANDVADLGLHLLDPGPLDPAPVKKGR